MSTRDGEVGGRGERPPRGRDRQPRGPRERGRGRGSDDAQSFWAGYDILWGPATGRPAARRSPLDRTRIVRAAIRIGDTEGLDAVSMRRIARELRTGAMSLYRHVPDKGALISLMIDEVIGEDELPAAPSGDWRADLWQVVNGMWATMQRHPWYPEAAMERPPITPNGVAALEYVLSIFDDSGLASGDRMGIVATLSATVTAVAINAAVEARTRARLQITEDEMMSSAGVFIGRIVESGKFPRFSELMSGFMSAAEPSDPQFELAAAVELILDGIAARLDAARPEVPRPEAARPGGEVRVRPAPLVQPAAPGASLRRPRPETTQRP
jgi:AcrR family transcriptional regulator